MDIISTSRLLLIDIEMLRSKYNIPHNFTLCATVIYRSMSTVIIGPIDIIENIFIAEQYIKWVICHCLFWHTYLDVFVFSIVGM